VRRAASTSKGSVERRRSLLRDLLHEEPLRESCCLGEQQMEGQVHDNRNENVERHELGNSEIYELLPERIVQKVIFGRVDVRLVVVRFSNRYLRWFLCVSSERC
jgi:hypothetical protein